MFTPRGPDPSSCMLVSPNPSVIWPAKNESESQTSLRLSVAHSCETKASSALQSFLLVNSHHPRLPGPTTAPGRHQRFVKVSWNHHAPACVAMSVQMTPQMKNQRLFPCSPHHTAGMEVQPRLNSVAGGSCLSNN